MKFKNYKSAIHNFAHSFQSIDYMKSPKLAVNILLKLYKQGLEPNATFDFINDSIKPEEAKSEGSIQLLIDYKDWLVEHCNRHNCDKNSLEKLEIKIWTDFEKAIVPKGMNNSKQICIQTKTIWKAIGMEEEVIKIAQDEVFNQRYLETGLPEM